jgi:DNA-binding MltR family transcriptional regulator
MKKEIAKLDHITLHSLPFLPARNRTKGYKIERKWGNTKVTITAIETLNTYDLITLILVLKEYLNNKHEEVKIDDTEIVQIVINVKKILRERGIVNKITNRETFFNSLKRLKTIELEVIKEGMRKVVTNYFFEIKADNEINTVKILANKKYINHLITRGIFINLNKILKYNNKEQYTVLLDLYLQGTKVKRKDGKYYLKNYYSNPEIEFALKLDLTNLPSYKKRQIIKKSFNNIFKDDEITYTYNKEKNIWVKTYKTA